MLLAELNQKMLGMLCKAIIYYTVLEMNVDRNILRIDSPLLDVGCRRRSAIGEKESVNNNASLNFLNNNPNPNL